MSPRRACAIAVVSTLLSAIGAPPASAAPPRLSAGEERAVREALHLERFAVLRVAVPRDVRGPLDLVLETEDGLAALALDPHSVRSKRFRLIEQGPDGARVVEAAAPATYRGFLHRTGARAAPERVAASLAGGQLTALVLGAGGASAAIQPLANVLPGAPADLYVTYDARDVVAGLRNCGVPAQKALAPPADGGGDVLEAQSLALAEIALEADLSLFQFHGSSTGNVVADLENVMNSVDAIYENDVGIRYEITDLLIETAGPTKYPSTDPDGFLDQFIAFWNANHQGIQRDVAHLFTAKTIDDGIGGVANLTVVCKKKLAYGFAWTTGIPFSERVAVTAHELGHNWSATHCDGDPDCKIMCSIAGGCTGMVDAFGSQAKGQIGNHKSTRTCLDTVPVPLGVPFAEDFKKKIKPSRWSQESTATISEAAAGEPSGTRAANLDARKDGTQDVLISQVFDLEGQTALELSCFVQQRGVEPGEALVLEYRDAAQQWQPLGLHVSDASDPAMTFERIAVPLPLGALHDRFQVRFTADVDSKKDDWYVDDVQVVSAPPGIQSRLCAGLASSTEIHVIGVDDPNPELGGVIENCGNVNAALDYSVSEMPDVPWLAPSQLSGTINPGGFADLFSVFLSVSNAATGLNSTVVRISNDHDASNFIDLPVSLIKVDAPLVQFGGALFGFIEPSPDEIDSVWFQALAGTKIKFGCSSPDAKLHGRVIVRDVAGELVDVWEFQPKTAAQTHKLKIQETGLYQLQVENADFFPAPTLLAPEFSAGWRITTKVKLPAIAKPRELVVKPKPPGADVPVPVALYAGSTLYATAVPLANGDGPFDLDLFDPDVSPLGPGSSPDFHRLLTGGVLLFGQPIANLGEHELLLSGFAAKEKLRVTLEPVHPAVATETYVP